METNGKQSSRTLTTVIPAISQDPSLADQIREAAARHGFEARFYASDAEALPALADTEVLFAQSATLAPHAPNLRWQCTSSAGINQFLGCEPFETGRAMLSNSSGAYGVTISEHVLMLILESLRRQKDYHAIVERREWTRTLPVRSIMRSRITLLGTGNIAQETARRLKAFSPSSLLGVNRSGANPEGLFSRIVLQSDLESVLPQTDILIITLPGTPETTHMLNASRLALLPDQALVVNVGRGSVVDQKALEKELRSGRLQAALDVFEKEPLPADSDLWDCPGLLITPHAAGNMTLPYTRERIVELFLEDFENYCEGRPLLRQVSLSKGY